MPQSDEEVEQGVAMSDVELDAHIGAIRAALTPEESETVRVMFEELVVEHRLIWAEKLSRMSVPEGVAFFRAQLAEAGYHPRARGAAESRAVGVPSGAPDSVRPPPSAPSPRSSMSAPLKPRRDARPVVGLPHPSGSPSATPPVLDGGVAIGDLGMVSPATQAHIIAIQSSLSTDEDMAMRAYVAALSPADRSAWIATLLMLPVADAVAMVRAQLAADRVGAAQPDDAGPDDGEGPDEGEELDHEQTLHEDKQPGDKEFDDEQPDDGQELDDGSVASGSVTGSRAALTAPVAMSNAGLPTLDPEAFVHFKTIEGALTFAERMRVFELGAQLSGTELRAWISELTALPVPEAVAKVRAALATAERVSRKARNGGVS